MDLKAVSARAEGFLRGSISSALTIAYAIYCKEVLHIGEIQGFQRVYGRQIL